jgi:phosphohistidine swiveling domain-containing protein
MNYKEIVLDFKKSSWRSIWSGRWSLMDCSDWGELYTKDKVIGSSTFVKKAVFVINNGKSTSWIDSDESQVFSRKVLKAHNNLTSIKALANQFQKMTDQALPYIEENKNKIDEVVFRDYWKFIRNYYSCHLQVKYIAESMPEKLIPKFLPPLQSSRVYGEPVFANTLVYNKFLAKWISTKTKITKDLCLYMTRQEMDQFLKNKKLPLVSVLKERFKFCVLVYIKNDLYIFSGGQAKEIEKIISEVKVKSDVIEGICAFPGVVRGSVRVINDISFDKNFKQGEILVAGMTRPEYLNIIKKAAAFITDTGGILSHAAIVARELMKPCIIGTKVATKILKDGMIVEVDANKGIVRIIHPVK